MKNAPDHKVTESAEGDCDFIGTEILRHSRINLQTVLPSVNPWMEYERLKVELTASATTPAEYERSCRLAADLVGV